MDTLNVSMPKAMKEYVQERVKTGGYGNTSEYVRELIRSEQKQRAKEELEMLILEGIQSGPGEVVNDEFWKRMNERVEKRVKATQRNKAK